MSAFIFIGLMLLCIGIALWFVRINRWPRVQVCVLKKWDEVTGRDSENNATAWQHADIEYWYQSKKILGLLVRRSPRAKIDGSSCLDGR